MTDTTLIVIKAYLELTPSEKQEFNREIEDYNRKTDFEKLRKKEQFNEQVRRATGPSAGSRCPLCGR